MVSENVLDEADFDGVVLLMDSCRTVEAEEDTVVYRDVLGVFEATVEAVLVTLHRQ